MAALALRDIKSGGAEDVVNLIGIDSRPGNNPDLPWQKNDPLSDFMHTDNVRCLSSRVLNLLVRARIVRIAPNLALFTFQ